MPPLRIASKGLLVAFLILSGCSDSGDQTSSAPDPDGVVPETVPAPPVDFGDPPTFPEGPMDDDLAAALDTYFAPLDTGRVGPNLAEIVAADDSRVAWLFADLLRFFQGEGTGDSLVDGFETLTGATVDRSRAWPSVTDHLIAWDTPAPPSYLDYKRQLFLQVEPGWEPLFADNDRIDWRHISWGGVRIDNRPAGDGSICVRGCIPALDDPATTPASGGDWYPDDAIVFGIEINGESRAYPKNQMEVHEMMNDTLGGRRLGIPYCTLCGSAQAWFTDELFDESNTLLTADQLDDLGIEPPLLRTSGLLIRSNKMMYDLANPGFVDTFTGVATGGPLAEAGVRFEQASVITTTWGDWKSNHPDTTILAEDGGIGENYPLDPLRGRDDDGPIFPVGDVDPRLGVQQPVLGVTTASGTPIAFEVASTRELLESGEEVTFEDITIVLDGDGLRAVRTDGSDAGGHQSFWFAWSQFLPDTELYSHAG